MRLVPRFAIWAVLAAAWFGTLGLRPLYKADETRYAEIPREMVASGDWITPRARTRPTPLRR